jgi:MFS family permease
MTFATPSSRQSPVNQGPIEEKLANAVDDPAPGTELGRPLDEFDEYEDAEKNYQPKSVKFWMIMISMYLSMFLVALDRTIIAAAIPKITNEFNSIEDIGWYGSAYMLATACLLPISGRIYQFYSTKWCFLISLVIFEAGSALCGAAPSSITFIIGRAIAGLASAGIFTGSMTIILPLVPLRKRPMYTSFFGVANGVASVAGPVMGGAFADKL